MIPFGLSTMVGAPAISSEWSEVYTHPTFASNTGGVGYRTYRQVFAGSVFAYNSTKVRVTFKASTTAGHDLYTVGASIVEQGTGANGAATPTQLKFAGATAKQITANTEATSDDTDFVIDTTKNYLIILDLGSSTNNQLYDAANTLYYANSSPSYLTQNVTGYTTGTYRFIISKIEVYH